jgi:hypothetical protein
MAAHRGIIVGRLKTFMQILFVPVVWLVLTVFILWTFIVGLGILALMRVGLIEE